jgi:hypothetical protein
MQRERRRVGDTRKPKRCRYWEKGWGIVSKVRKKTMRLKRSERDEGYMVGNT